MADLEERVTSLEGHSDNHALALNGVRNEIVELRADLRTSVADVRAELRTAAAELRSDVADLRAELRTAAAELRSEMATRGDIGDVRREMGDLRNEVGDLRKEMSRQFVWLVGIMTSGFITVIGALAVVALR